MGSKPRASSVQPNDPKKIQLSNLGPRGRKLKQQAAAEQSESPEKQTNYIKI